MMNARKILLLGGSCAALVAAVGASVLLTSQPARATAQFATQTGKSCTACHTSPEGGASLTPYGEKFKANGNKLPPSSH